MSYRYQEKRHKAIVVPIVRSSTETRFLTVKDSRHQEWIFVTGGCKKSEVECPLKCGLRELEEETRGVINIKTGEFSEFEFETVRSPEELKKDGSEGSVTLVYHVYIINLDVTQEQQKSIVQQFHANRAPMEQNKRVSKVLIEPTYKDHPKFFQKGIFCIRIAMLSQKCGPNQTGGGTLKMSARKWVENTNIK